MPTGTPPFLPTGCRDGYLIGREDLWPISVGMSSYFTGQFVTLPHLIQATAIMALALPLLLFQVAQRVFVQGVVVTGIDK